MKFILIFIAALSLHLKARACSSPQSLALQNSRAQVVQRIRALEVQWPSFRLDQVKQNFVIPQNRLWDASSPRYSEYHRYWQKLSDTFVQMRLALESQQVNFNCDSSWHIRCGGDTKAYVLFMLGRPFKTLHFCPLFFTLDASSQAATVMHELSHSTSSTHDHALAWSQGERSDLILASEDAYHIEEFFAMDARMLMLRTSWNWLFPIQH